MMKILLTGFEPFGKVHDNPSQRVVEHFAAKGLASKQNVELITAVLPVDYVAATKILADLLLGHNPDAVLMLGVAQMRDSINLERIAININDAKIADNAGNMKTGQAIVEDAPVAYRSTLPLEAMYQALQDAGIAVTYSNHAGAYLCNHVFYMARHLLETMNLGHIPCGFIHLPDMGEEAPKMPLAKMIEAVGLALKVIVSKKETFSDVLKRFEQRLPEKPEWIVLTSVDGLIVGAVNIDPALLHEERDPSPMLVALLSLSERVNEELKLGLFNYAISAGNLGLILILPVHDEYIVGMKFGKGTTYRGLANIGNILPNALEEVLRKLE